MHLAVIMGFLLFMKLKFDSEFFSGGDPLVKIFLDFNKLILMLMFILVDLHLVHVMLLVKLLLKSLDLLSEFVDSFFILDLELIILLEEFFEMN